MSINTEIVTDIPLCAGAIKKGEIVAFGTETVYGLGADCFNEEAVKKIFKAKGRPSDNPLIVHVCDIEQAKLVAKEWTEEMDRLAKAFFPGPFTMVVKKSNSISSVVSAGLDTVGIRMPGNFMAVDFIKECGTPIAAPSANTSGRPSPTTAQHVYNDMNGKIHCILDCGASVKGLESTVYDVEAKTVLRPGVVTPEDIGKVVGEVKVSGEEVVQTPKSPGTKYAHYHPTYRVVLVKGKNSDEKIKELCKKADKDGEKYVILDIQGGSVGNVRGFNGNLEAAAAELYGLMLEYEDRIDVLFVKGIEKTGVGLAVMNRLERAAYGNIIEAE